jgi:hypothetical protein
MRLTSDSMFDSMDSAGAAVTVTLVIAALAQLQPGGVTVRARFGYPATRHAAPRFPWLRIRNMTQSLEPDDGA